MTIQNVVANTIAVCLLGGFFLGSAIAATAADPAGTTKLTAAQIVERNVAARGGLEAWRRVQSISMAGKMDAGKLREPYQVRGPSRKQGARAQTVSSGAGANADVGKTIQLPYVMELQRPHKMRVELVFKDETAVQVYDGVNGWKLRPYLGRKDVDPYTAEELKTAAEQQELDGPLINYAAKGTKVALAGIEPVEGRDAYKLKLTLKGGQVRHVWVDKQTFLDVKMDGAPRRLDGKPHAVAIYLRDYKSVDGLMIPHLLETTVQGVKDSQTLTIERVALNPKLEEARFAKP